MPVSTASGRPNSLLFATMGVCVKLASALYPPGEIVFYRGLVGVLLAYAVTRAQRGSLRTRVPAMHFWRSLCGVLSLVLWFHAIGGLPLATAVTLNYLSSVWMALFLLAGSSPRCWSASAASLWCCGRRWRRTNCGTACRGCCRA